MTDINFRANCRKCGKPMKRASALLETTLYCTRCKVRAIIEFTKTPTVHALNPKQTNKGKK